MNHNISEIFCQTSVLIICNNQTVKESIIAGLVSKYEIINDISENMFDIVSDNERVLIVDDIQSIDTSIVTRAVLEGRHYNISTYIFVTKEKDVSSPIRMNIEHIIDNDNSS